MSNITSSSLPNGSEAACKQPTPGLKDQQHARVAKQTQVSKVGDRRTRAPKLATAP